jgi:methyl acetate hydrolase
MPTLTTLSLSERGRSEIDALLQTACERLEVPGVVAAVANRERLLYLGAAGTLDEAGALRVPTDAIFRIASMTKPITSVGIMQLCEQGRLGLDDPLGEYLPEFKGRAVIADFDASDGSYTTRPASGEVSIRQLLSHTAGFGYEFCSHTLNGLSKGNTSPLRDLPLLHDPGSRWTYGRSTALLGEVIARVAAEPLDAYFAAHIFGPLGMTDTAFGVKPEDIGRLVTLYHRVDGALSAEPRPAAVTPNVAGDGGLLGAASDYIRFLQMLLNGGALAGGRLLRETSVAEMTRNQIGNLTVEEQPGAIPRLSRSFPLGAGADKFGLGFQLKTNAEEGARSPGSYSWAGLYNTHFWGDPNKGIAAVLLMQVLPFYDARCIALLRDFERRIYANLE